MEVSTSIPVIPVLAETEAEADTAYTVLEEEVEVVEAQDIFRRVGETEETEETEDMPLEGGLEAEEEQREEARMRDIVMDQTALRVAAEAESVF